ncbi:hypothetical protein GON05_33260 [Paenibacillus sp. MAH-34]|uniref:50S ribosomal protein L29 n=2 Tax=Paenibacillus TaxID=44249 RepID=A0ABW9UKE8_9BACL|nr:hypothetical protein [Paenibacillus anseongense]MVQ39471.1 hypothetical protein [Paenibacillus anseongense]
MLEEIQKRIDYLKLKEIEYKKANNVSGRLNAKTRRQELQRLEETICEKYAVEKKADGIETL